MESEGTPAPIVDVPETVPADTVPLPDAIEPSPTPSEPATSDDDKDATSEDSDKKEIDRKKTIDQEVVQLGETIENTTTQEFIKQLSSIPPADRLQFVRDNLGLQFLRNRDLVKKLVQVTPGKMHQLSTDATGATARYRTTDGKGILGIKHIDTATQITTLRIAVPGGVQDIPMPRAELLQIMLQADRNDILASLPAQDRAFMEKYFASQLSEAKADDYYEGLPEVITAVAEAHDIPTTRRLFKALESRYASAPIPPDASPEDTARITADNAQKTEFIAEIQTKLEGNNLANADQLKMTMDLLGITPKNLTAVLENTRIESTRLRKAIESEKDADKKAEYKTQLDTIDATAQIYQEIQGILAADPDGKYAEKFLESQRAGNVPAELAKHIAESLDKGEIEALVHMVSPEASISATAEEKKKFREAREKQVKILKGMGITAALLALLVALGISQGTKQ